MPRYLTIYSRTFCLLTVSVLSVDSMIGSALKGRSNQPPAAGGLEWFRQPRALSLPLRFTPAELYIPHSGQR